jgi:hypothetical protein
MFTKLLVAIHLTRVIRNIIMLAFQICFFKNIFELIICPSNGADEINNLWNHFHNIFKFKIFRYEMYTAKDAEILEYLEGSSRVLFLPNNTGASSVATI